MSTLCFPFFFFFNDTATTEIYTLSLHDALPILRHSQQRAESFLFQLRRSQHGDREPMLGRQRAGLIREIGRRRSEEHTSELQSPCNLVCRLLLEKKKKEHVRVRPHVRSAHHLPA